MKQILLSAIAVIAMTASPSCIRKEIDATDKSIIRSVSVSIDNDSYEWEINKERRLTISYRPDDAAIIDIAVQHEGDVFEVKPTKERHVFNIIPTKEGEGGITAIVNGVRSQELEFSVFDDTPVRQRPEVSLEISRTATPGQAEVCEDMRICDYGDEFHLSAKSETEGLTFSLESSDEDVIGTVWSNAGNWVISARSPGRAKLELKVTETDGMEWIYTYDFIVYGHISLEAKCNPTDGKAGIIVNDMAFRNIDADVYITPYLSGCPGKKTEMTETIRLDAVNKRLSLQRGSDYSDILDISDEMQWFYDKGSIGDSDWWGAYMIEMHIFVRLDNPYIIIDDIIDDYDRGYPDYINFTTSASLEQVGIADDDTGTEPDTGHNSGGWTDHDITIYL